MQTKPSVRFVCLLLMALFMLTACGKGAFVNEIQGKWQVTEINYLSDNGTTTDYPTDMFFLFQGNTYQSITGTTVGESGNFDVNFKVTQITFYSSLGISTMLIQEKSDVFQHWRTKHKIIDLYLDFKLTKIE